MVSEQLAGAIMQIAISVVISVVVSLVIMGITIQEKGRELIQQLLESEKMRVLQQKSASTRVSRTASKKVAEDLMTNTPLSQVVSVLSEETREYLAEHPEALPEVIQNYAGTLDLGLKLMPQLTELLGKVPKQARPQYDL